MLGYIGQNIGSAVSRNRGPGTDKTPGQTQVAASIWLIRELSAAR